MLNFLKGGGWIIPVLLLVVGWVQAEMRAAGDRREAEIMADSARASWDALLDSINTWAEREQVWDSTEQALTAKLSTQSTASRVATANALEDASVSRQVLAKLRDSLSVATQVELDLVEAGLDRLEEANEACNDALETCEELVVESRARIYDVEAQLEQSTAVARQQAFVIEGLRELGQPRLGLWGYAGWLVAIGEAALIVITALR